MTTSMMLTGVELAWMRTIIEQTLPDTCNILSESLASDGEGGVTSTWGTASANVACRLDSAVVASNQIVPVSGAQRTAHQYLLSLPYDTAINAGNRVEIGTSTYTVTSVNDNQSWMAVGRATLELI